QVDARAGVPPEVVVRLAGTDRARAGGGQHVEPSAADEVRRNADAWQTPHDVTRRADGVELGTDTSLLTKLVVRAIDAKTNWNEGQVDSHRRSGVVTQVGAVLQVAHWLSNAASDAKLERLQHAELRV